MTQILLVLGIALTLFVGYNIGGSTTGPAFGPAVGSDSITKVTAAGLMSVFFFSGAFTLGRRVVDTLGEELVTSTAIFTLQSNVAVLFFIGVSLFLGNYFGVPASTSMTAVGAIAGLALAAGKLDWTEMGKIMAWWIVAPVIAFWVSGVIGRYFYSRINQRVALVQSDGPLIELEWGAGFPVKLGPNTTVKEFAGTFTVVAIGCLMAFSSGTSNIANAIAPLVGSNDLGMNRGIIIGSVAVGIGAFTIGRRTLDTLGNDLTSLPLTASIVVASVSSTLVIFLSAIGIPASFVIIATMSIIGLGWGRATRTTTVEEMRSGEPTAVSPGALASDEGGKQLPDIGEEEPEEIPAAGELFDPATTVRVVLMQNIVPLIATVGAYLTFRFLPVFSL